jgi:nicotinate-nucleotide adenylyltransferase
MRLGLYGGTFDPIHVGHLAAAEEAAYRLRLDQVLFVPAVRQPLKDRRPGASAEDRLAMLRAAIDGNMRFGVSTLELERPAPSYTVETLRLLRQSHGPACELFLLVGVDAANTLQRWREPAEILRLTRLVVMSRGAAADPDWGMLQAIIPDARLRVDLLAVPDIDVSASEIRRRAAAGEPFRYQVVDPVWEYVQSHGLYRPEASGDLDGL